MKNLIIRTLTGAVYVALLVGCTIYSPLTSFFFFAIVAALAVWEFCSVVNNHYEADVNPRMNALAAFILVAAVWGAFNGMTQFGTYFALYAFTLLYILISELYREAENPLRNWALAFAAQVYVALPFALMPLLRPTPEVWQIALALFIFLWTSDTGAYLVGSTFGRFVPYKLFPRISPNKSWIGSIGGGLLTLGAAAIMWHFFGILHLYVWLGYGVVVCIFGTWGDLVESLLKRQLGIKDSGKILPGHGGMLDRFDSALLAIPAAIIYFLLLSSYIQLPF